MLGAQGVLGQEPPGGKPQGDQERAGFQGGGGLTERADEAGWDGAKGGPPGPAQAGLCPDSGGLPCRFLMG